MISNYLGYYESKTPKVKEKLKFTIEIDIKI